MKKLLICILTIITLLSCSNDDDNNSTELRIRLSNASQFDFQNITVNTSTGNVVFEDMNVGQNSEYQVFQSAYRYAFVELEIDGETYTIQPIDYVGETLLENGDYTYQINANNSLEQYEKLSLTLIVD